MPLQILARGVERPEVLRDGRNFDDFLRQGLKMGKQKYTDEPGIRYPETPVFSQLNWDRYQQFIKNWQFSLGMLTKLNARLNEHFKDDNSFSVLVAGSYGRMDAHEDSDLDFMIVHNGYLTDEEDKVGIVRNIAKELNIGTPNPEGAFSRPIHLDKMLDTIGSKDDDLNSTAQRLLILMEGRAIYNRAFFNNIMMSILDHYLRYVREEPEKEALVLLNDLIKYFRNICINVEFSFWQDESKWGIRNVKLTHSRILIYAGLLLLILTSSKHHRDKIHFLKKYIFASPIEKIYIAYQENNDSNFERVIATYNIFLNKLIQDSVRNELKNLEYPKRFTSNSYVELKANADFLQAELTRFILDNRTGWTSKAFEYLVF